MITRQMIATALELRTMGYKWHDIAYRLNVSEAALQRKIRRAEREGFAAFDESRRYVARGKLFEGNAQ